MSLVTSISLELSDIEETIDLGKLSHARNPHSLNRRKACLPGTRTSTLDEIIGWICDPTASRARFILGPAGAGKSAVAHAIGQHFNGLRRLAALVSFDSNFANDCHPNSFLCTLALSIADWNTDFRKALHDVLKRESQSHLQHSPEIEQQWKLLIVEPAKAVAFVGAVVVV
ncbi:hypothetical protein EXIGLDRAFT_798434, partial [Exidia glandulosa HHB12029]